MVQCGICLPMDLVRQIKELARVNDATISAVARTLIRRGMASILEKGQKFPLKHDEVVIERSR